MRILVIGGYGLVGGAVITRLTAHGHMVYGAGRDIAQAERRFPQVRWVKADLGITDPNVWSHILDGMDVVVNCVGALQDNPLGDQRTAYLGRLRRLGEAAQTAGVKRFVHVSASGMEAGPNAFGLEGLTLDWVVLRPGLLLASAAFGSSALLRALAAFPGFVPVLHPEAKVQVASLYDVADAVAAAVQPGAPKRIAIDLVNAEQLTVGEMLQTWRAWLGAPPAPLLILPPLVARAVETIADGLGLLGWRSPLRTAAFAQMSAGVGGDSSAATRWLGVRMRGLNEILALSPSGLQERWFARLYSFKPLCLLSLAMFWIASGANGLVHRQAAVTALSSHGVAPNSALALTGLVSMIDMMLGVLACWRRTVRPALYGMLLMAATYVLGGGLGQYGLAGSVVEPLIQMIPSAVLVLAALSILDER